MHIGFSLNPFLEGIFMRLGGLVGWMTGTLLMVAVGIFILSRTPLWPYIRKS